MTSESVEPSDLGRDRFIPTDAIQAYRPSSGRSSLVWSKRVVPNAIVIDGVHPDVTIGGTPHGITTRRMTFSRHSWSISGTAVTGADGAAYVSINELLELPDCVTLADQDHWGPAIIDSSPTFIATAHSPAPIIVVAEPVVEPIDDGISWRFKDPCDGTIYNDEQREYRVQMAIRSFSLDGSLVNAKVSWLCIADGALRWRAT